MTDQILRHVNGGAQKVGSEVHVSADSFADCNSVVEGDSCILTSSVLRASLFDSQIYRSTLWGCLIKKSTVADSSVQCMVLTDSLLHRVLSDRPTSITLKNVVAENCELYGSWTLSGNARIPTGIWHRAPRYKRITGDNGVDIGLTESTNGHALMACWRKPITKWLKYGPRLGAKHRWTAQQVEDARLFFQELLDCPMEGVIPSDAT